MTYTDEYRTRIRVQIRAVCACILYPSDCISVLLSQYYEFILLTKYKVILEKLKYC